MNTIIDTNLGEIITVVGSEEVLEINAESSITLIEAQDAISIIEVFENILEVNETLVSSEITLIEPFTEIISIQEAEQVLTFTDVGVQGLNGISPSVTTLEIMGMYKNSVNTYYTEYIRNMGNITEINVWTDSLKSTKLFEKIIIYLDGDVIGYVIKDISNSKILTVSFEFDIEGNIVNKLAIIN